MSHDVMMIAPAEDCAAIGAALTDLFGEEFGLTAPYSATGFFPATHYLSNYGVIPEAYIPHIVTVAGTTTLEYDVIEHGSMSAVDHLTTWVGGVLGLYPCLDPEMRP